MPRVTKATLQAEIDRLSGELSYYQQYVSMAQKQSVSLAEAEKEVNELRRIIADQANAMRSMASKTGSDY
jgi:prefoldin subunit 5